MKGGKVGFENRGLMVLLCVLVVVIVGFGIGTVIILSIDYNSGKIAENNWTEDVEGVVAEYQRMIESEEDNTKKEELYEERFYYLVDKMKETDADYCIQASDDMGELFELMDSEEIGNIIGALPDECIEEGEGSVDKVTFEVNGENL